MIFAFLSMNNLNAQINAQNAKDVANSLFELCGKNNYSSAASLLAYHGSDESRLYKSTYNYSNSSEAADVKRFCNRIKAMIEISDSYEFGSFGTKKTHGNEVKSLEVIFKSGSQKIKNKLTFVLVNNNTVVLSLD